MPPPIVQVWEKTCKINFLGTLTFMNLSICYVHILIKLGAQWFPYIVEEHQNYYGEQLRI